jgi:hypothetical protein
MSKVGYVSFRFSVNKNNILDTVGIVFQIELTLLVRYVHIVALQWYTVIFKVNNVSGVFGLGKDF